MIKLALVGRNISHSKSQQMYEEIYGKSIDYTLLDFQNASEIPTLKDLFLNYMGISITAPYKEHFLSQVVVSEEVLKLKAVNCIAHQNGKYFATNTDYLAVEEIFRKSNYEERNIVVLGDGAMSRVTIAVLEKLGKNAKFINRKEYGDLNQVNYSSLYGENLLVINACARAFQFKAELPEGTIFWDYNYSHHENTIYLKDKCRYVDGINLLFMQAKFATEFWQLCNK